MVHASSVTIEPGLAAPPVDTICVGKIDVGSSAFFIVQPEDSLISVRQVSESFFVVRMSEAVGYRTENVWKVSTPNAIYFPLVYAR